MDLLEELSRVVKFNYTLTMQEGTSYRMLVNKLDQKEIDLVVADLTLNEERANVTFPHHSSTSVLGSYTSKKVKGRLTTFLSLLHSPQTFGSTSFQHMPGFPCCFIPFLDTWKGT